MPNNWKTYRLEDALEILIDYRGKTPKKTTNGIPLVTAKIVKKGTIQEPNEFIAEEDYDKWMVRGFPKKGDVVLTTEAPLGEVAIINNDKIALAQRIVTLRGAKNILHSTYLKYFLQSSIGQNRLIARESGTTVTGIKQSELRKVLIDCPPYKEQKAIASILSAIDDKIENNLVINKTLEDMAMALYKHWFVDFGPFQDGEFIDSELGPMPKGWEVKRLEDLIEKLSKGTTPRMKDVGDLECTIPFLKVKDINSVGEIDESGLGHIPESIHLNQLKRSVLNTDDLLFSIAGTIGRVSIVPESLDNANCNQALAFIRLRNKHKFNILVYNWLKSEETQKEIKSSIVQGVQANVSLTVLKELNLVLPNDEVINDFLTKSNPIHYEILENLSENQSLTKLRDTLLPKLISGEVRLKEFREQVKEVI